MKEETGYYDSWKEDRDIILEYNQVSLDDVNIINILSTGIDNLTCEQAVVKVMKMIEDGDVHHVIPLNPYKIHRIKSSYDTKLISSKASMLLATGGGIQWAAKMRGTPLKERVPLLSFLMDLVRISEVKEYTIFFVGAKSEIVEKAYCNIKKSFPKIRIIGRHGGFFNEEREKSVVEAIRKSEADIIFVGLGFPQEDKWINKIRNEFRKGVFISVGGCIDILSGEIKKAPPFFMKNGFDWFYRIITRPWRYGRLLRLFLLYFEIIIRKIFS